MNKKEMLESLWEAINTEEHLHLEQEIKKIKAFSDATILKMAAETLSNVLVHIRATSWEDGREIENSVVVGTFADAIHNMPGYIREKKIDCLVVDIARYNCLLNALDS